MTRTLIILTLALPLAACGLADTAATGAAGAASEVEAAKQARQTEEKAQQQVEQAIQVDAQKRAAADDDAH